MILSLQQIEIMRAGVQPEAGQLLRAWREDKGWDQHDIARRLDSSNTAVCTWETGKRWPDGSRRELLLHMVSDGSQATKIVVHSGITFAELEDILFQAQTAGKDSLERTAAILDAASDKVTLTLAVAATGGLDYAAQVSKAIELFFKVRKDVQEELRLRQLESKPRISRRGQDWLTGKESAIVKRERKVEHSVMQSETTISSEDISLHNTPTATSANHTTTGSNAAEWGQAPSIGGGDPP